MKTIAQVLAAVAAAALATTAVAGSRVTDTAYLKAAQCHVLAHATDADTTSLDAFMREQGKGRSQNAKVRINLMRQAAKEAVARGESALLVKELESRCGSWSSARTVADSGSSAAR